MTANPEARDVHVAQGRTVDHLHVVVDGTSAEVTAAYMPELGTFAISGPGDGGLGIALEGHEPQAEIGL